MEPDRGGSNTVLQQAWDRSRSHVIIHYVLQINWVAQITRFSGPDRICKPMKHST
jgi:hypothetical protein